MGNATSALVDKDFASVFSTKKNKTLQDRCQSYAQQKSHDTRNGEDTKGTLQVLFLCKNIRVVFIVDICSINRLILCKEGWCVRLGQEGG